MKRPHPAWLLTIFVLALLPAGFRMLTWRTPRHAEVDNDMARAGKTLFNREWTAKDPLANGGDGLGPVFNANSCKACHNQGGVGGAGGLEHNVTAFIVQRDGETKAREGVVHLKAASGFQESLSQLHPDLPNGTRLPSNLLASNSMRNCTTPFRFPPGIHISERNTPALFGVKLIDEISERDIIANERKERLNYGLAPSDNETAPVGRAHRLADGRIGRFGWKAQTASLSEFVQAACANELGLSNPAGGYGPDAGSVQSVDGVRRFLASATRARVDGAPWQESFCRHRLRQLSHAQSRLGGWDLQRPASAPHGPAAARRRFVWPAAPGGSQFQAARWPAGRRMADAALVGRGRFCALSSRWPGQHPTGCNQASRWSGCSLRSSLRQFAGIGADPADCFLEDLASAATIEQVSGEL